MLSTYLVDRFSSTTEHVDIRKAIGADFMIESVMEMSRTSQIKKMMTKNSFVIE